MNCTPNEMLLMSAMRESGVRELRGREKNNPVIMGYVRECGHMWPKVDELAWCSSYANAMTRRLSMPSTGSLRARSWCDVEDNDLYTVETIHEIDDLLLGDHVVLWRGKRNGNQGHIAQYVARRRNYLRLWGGNQSNQVCEKPYPEFRFLMAKRYVLRETA